MAEKTELQKLKNIIETFKDYQESLILTPLACEQILDAYDYEEPIEETPQMNLFDTIFSVVDSENKDNG